ncbi:MAG: acireductone synthase [Oceanococcaceae bacterium]
MSQPAFILTDIEGTTSSIAFVHQVLFPYAREAFPAFLKAHAQEPEVQAQIQSVAMEVGCDPADLSLVLAALLSWMDADRKVTSLKALQGMIWKEGYARGALQSHVYPDAVDALRRWHAAGVRLGVYSSGSVPAQKLLFGHTPVGDLQPLFSAWFDTRVGGKREAASYSAIAEGLQLPTGQILFLSDVGAELDAAAAVGMRTMQLLRPEDGAEPAAAHTQVASFADIHL